MKYVKPLQESERITLEELLKNHSSSRARARAHAVLLSNRGFNLNEIARIFEIDRDTASRWLSDWEKNGIAGLHDDPRSGRPNKLTEEEILQLQSMINEEPRSIRQVAAKIKEKFNKEISIETIKRIAKKLNFVWKRIRKSLKAKRDEESFLQAKLEIKQLQESQKTGALNLYYFDASGLSLQPLVPYAWQLKGQHIEIVPSKSPRLNVLGFLSVNHDFSSFIVQGNVDAMVIIACFDAFIEKLDKPTWIILDNAPQHTSQAFKAKIPMWEKNGLFIKYLPPYSPELNLIEIVWRFLKYAWLPFSAYLNFNSLQSALEEVLKNVGKKYQITFV